MPDDNGPELRRDSVTQDPTEERQKAQSDCYNVTGGVFAGNPFPAGDPRHGLWSRANRLMEERLARLNADTLQKVPGESEPPERFVKFRVTAFAGTFDIVAEFWLSLSTPDYGEAKRFDEVALQHVYEEILSRSESATPRDYPKSVFLSQVRIALEQRRAHWKAEALRLAREAEDATPTGTAPMTADQANLAVLAEAVESPTESPEAPGQSKDDANGAVPATNLGWSDVEIHMDSMHMAQIRIGDDVRNATYTEMGFADRRGKGKNKPNGAWRMLHHLAWKRGVLDLAAYGRLRGRALAHMRSLNKTLQKYFSRHFPATSAPIEHERGRGHVARFAKIDANRAEGPFL
jgi:hypothetical protein